MINRIRYIFRFYRGTFFKTEIDTSTKDIYKTQTQYSFKEIEPHLFKTEPIFAQKNRTERFCRRYEQGHRCYGFFDSQGRIISYLWISIADDEIYIPWILNLKLVLRPGNAYIWDCFTAEDYRRRGLYKWGLLNVKSILFKRGAERIYIFCADGNIYSKAGIISAGFSEAFRFFVVSLSPLCFIKKFKGKFGVAIRGQTYDIIDS